MQHALRLALLQCEAMPLDIELNLERLDEAAKEAKSHGADLLVTPEMMLTGYNIGAEQVQRWAQPAQGDFFLRVATLARHHGIAMAYGYPERVDSGQVFNAVQLIDAEGAPLCNYRKTHLFGVLDKEQFSAGEVCTPLCDFLGWRIGLLICYDIEFPENARRLALAGADLLVVPTANMPDYDFVATTMVPTRAYENQVFIAYANYVGHEGDVHYGGLSTVAAPDGQVLAQAGRTVQIVYASLEPGHLAEARARLTHLADARALAAMGAGKTL